ncbi:hypothetical protein C0989_001066, partial [Termitomyces sp. Mn162]
YLLRILQVKKIPFNSYDLASDESAKRLWKRRAPAGKFYAFVATLDYIYGTTDKQQLPGILVGNQFPGLASEDAVECGELDSFLRLNETWHEDEDQPVIPAQPIGVPGAVLPLQMTPEHLRRKILAQPPPDSPLKGKKTIPDSKRHGKFDISTELEGYGLQGVNVTEEELKNLVAELGLDGDEAGDLAKELSGPPSNPPSQIKAETEASGNSETLPRTLPQTSDEDLKSGNKPTIHEEGEATKASA